MRLIETHGDGVAILIERNEVFNLGGKVDAIRAWSQGMGLPMDVTRDGDGARIGFPERSVALSFLGSFVPGGLADVARPVADGVGDFAEVSERDGTVEVTIRYVGDAGAGTGQEPHDRTSEDFAIFSERAREAGFEAEHRHSDHDTIEVLLTPLAPELTPGREPSAMAR